MTPSHSPRSLYLSVKDFEIHVSEWGEAEAPALVMWHGLGRTGRDFDVIARYLSVDRGFRVICPDTIGRGWSSWSSAPERDYTLATYTDHAETLLNLLGVERCDWIGTSMGGLVGLAAATGTLDQRITRLVLNDVGPVLNQVAVERIKTYTRAIPTFASMAELESYFRIIYAGYGVLTDPEWRAMTETSARRRDDGLYTLHYDPKVMSVFGEGAFDMWAEFDRLGCPVLVLRGESSDLLTVDIANQMTRRGPGAQLITVPGCGHAPGLNTPEQIALIDAFLG